ncbi:cell division cycle 20, cofactor of APC complex [Strigomonas culicis]|uniref:Cell division cycle 20, cofactor of APC complex n=1 Tax=Strigomonas culicis TaxID=28005 RepID=S9VP30_9TRYP|nr:cell division cycle 20, cofactor of APC complex [Strigomonas culicis]|eukprot:EPY28781.1 cell division cycle 20, cofactor of APC complex [Strigomonas culicis]
MRQWAADQNADSPGSKYSVFANKTTSHALQVRTNLNSNPSSSPPKSHFAPSREGRSSAGDEAVPSTRLSRHIPQREGVDMSVSAFNLMGQASLAAAPAFRLPHSSSALTLPTAGPGALPPASHRTPTASSSAMTSCSDSQISDDSFYTTSLYSDMLADKLSSREPHHAADDDADEPASPYGGGHPRRGAIGGEVLRFGGVDAHGAGSGDRRRSSASSAALAMPFPRSRVYAAAGKGRAGPARALCSNPERVLDAPEFPTDASQLLHWGSNNKLIIGLKNSVYVWDAESGQAGKLTDLPEHVAVRCIHWLHKCACVALSVAGGTTAIYDCRAEEMVRSLRVPDGTEVTGVTVNGPVMAVGTDRGVAKVYDLRAKHAVIQTYDGHRGAVTSVQYCASEPYYLATGGEDGNVRVWDARHSSPRYVFDGVHQGAVAAAAWNPMKRSRLFTGGADGVLCHIDTHAAMRSQPGEDQPLCGGEDSAALGGRAAQFITRAVKTNLPITGIVCHVGGEVATAHRERGQIQLRRASTFHLLGTFTSPNCDAGLSCMTLSPDRERVCAAQADETLKFWRVFDNKTVESLSPRANDAWAHQDPNACADQALR